MSLQSNISTFVSRTATEFNSSRTWAQSEFNDVYTTIQGVIDTVPTNTSELTNDSGFITGIGNITEITLRSYWDMQDLPILNTSNWDTAYGWGDHGLAGYITSESDPVFTASPAFGIAEVDKTNWDSAYSWGNHASQGYLTSETDPVFQASPAGTITATNKTNWNSAYGWGNHASVGYITSESDPVFTASPAFGVTEQNKTNWSTAYSWGNHASQGYLTSLPVHNHDSLYYRESEVDTLLNDKVDKITGQGLSDENFTLAEKNKLASLEGSLFKGTYTSLANLNTAHPTPIEGSYAHVDAGVGNDVELYIWDNNDTQWVISQGNATAETAASVKTKYESNPDTNAYDDISKAKVDGLPANVESVTGAQTKANTAESNANLYTDTEITNHNHTGIYEPVFTKNSGFNLNIGTASGTVAAGNDSRINNGQTAFGWGNHASQGYVTSESDPVFQASPASTITEQNKTDWSTVNNKLDKQPNIQGFWRGTQAEYDALTPDPNTVYFIKN